MATWVANLHPATGVVRLDEDEALDASVVGSKAANLARARRAGLPSLGGFVLPVDAVTALRAGWPLSAAALDAYDELSDRGTHRVVVRSSSPSEDTASSSQAGRFTSVVAVDGLEAFADAVGRVAASAGRDAMAVLVQRHVDPALSGVAFGVDPVTGRADRQVVAAVQGGPQALVSGTVTGDRYELGRRGRLVAVHRGDGGTDLGRVERRAVARLAAGAAGAFGGPQDIEWARTVEGDTLLLQARPVTASTAPVTGPCYAPGPLAETFPAPLSALEEALWLPPLRAAIAAVAALTGRASRRRAGRSPVVVAPGGRPAVDAELAGVVRRHGLLAAVDPRPGVRRLRAAWRTGRLAAALPALAADVVADADAALRAVPRLDRLDDRELRDVLRRSVEVLTSLHGHEVLAGALLDGGDAPVTGAEVALHALRRARADGLDDDEARTRYPEILALSAPAIVPPAGLPADPPALRSVTVDALGPREALRLRVRWVHELTARVALELGRRLAAQALLSTGADVRHLNLDALDRALDGEPVVVRTTAPGPPLPALFRLAADGTVVAAEAPATHEDAGAGVGAGGGRGAGPVHLGDDPPPGSVLVVGVLDPALAAHLPRLAGLVAETGSPLSHLAILAREHGVATVVGAAGARRRWSPGDVVVVDGTAGTVKALEHLEART